MEVFKTLRKEKPHIYSSTTVIKSLKTNLEFAFPSMVLRPQFHSVNFEDIEASRVNTLIGMSKPLYVNPLKDDDEN